MSKKKPQSRKNKNFKDIFSIKNTLGCGSNGKVKLGINKQSGEKVSIKVIKKKKNEVALEIRKSLKKQIKILKTINHSNLLRFKRCFQTKHKYYLVSEYIAGEELLDLLNTCIRFKNNFARKIFIQLVNAIHHCHNLGIVHLDIKLENIIVNQNGNIQLIDFDVATFTQKNRLLKTFCGSPLYQAPEIVSKQAYNGKKVDIWCLGVVLYTMLCGKHPFREGERVLPKNLHFPSYLNFDVISLIKKLLKLNPKKRITTEKILEHKWINKASNEQKSNDNNSNNIFNENQNLMIKNELLDFQTKKITKRRNSLLLNNEKNFIQKNENDLINIDRCGNDNNSRNIKDNKYLDQSGIISQKNNVGVNKNENNAGIKN
ncbi:map/microtubule affinity-regulating kinase [Anaeramoeba flamelloides]|uniref:Map/microtubule affinity-regulating kinase n=1 Tax=Anaeramoeba flamelloides TaxID=1746091 RepID=A0AAV7ZR24_9EUKA|nr:map/microtubule affinity-regulating kinase [Anaeramoeba flamelloides]